MHKANKIKSSDFWKLFLSVRETWIWMWSIINQPIIWHPDIPVINYLVNSSTTILYITSIFQQKKSQKIKLRNKMLILLGHSWNNICRIKEFPYMCHLKNITVKKELTWNDIILPLTSEVNQNLETLLYVNFSCTLKL